MKLDTTSFFFNSVVTGQAGGQAAWGTSLGQERAKGFPIQMGREGVSDIVAGMVHNACTDSSGMSAAGMSCQRELVLFSVFDKVFVNGNLLPNTSFIMSIVREHTKTSEGKMHLSYAPYYKYTSVGPDGSVRVVSNAETMEKISDFMGCRGGSWFVRKIEISAQNELRFRVVVVNAAGESSYATHAERSRSWDRLVVMDILNESGSLMPLSSDSFKKYLTELLPSAMSVSRASACCKSLDTTLVRSAVKTVTGRDDGIFGVETMSEAKQVLDLVKNDYENTAIYSGIPAESLSLFCDFLESAVEKPGITS